MWHPGHPMFRVGARPTEINGRIIFAEHTNKHLLKTFARPAGMCMYMVRVETPGKDHAYEWIPVTVVLHRANHIFLSNYLTECTVVSCWLSEPPKLHTHTHTFGTHAPSSIVQLLCLTAPTSIKNTPNTTLDTEWRNVRIWNAGLEPVRNTNCVPLNSRYTLYGTQSSKTHIYVSAYVVCLPQNKRKSN